MNTSHYPSLELCKKLTEIGFPETEKCFCPNCFWTWKECCNNPDHSFFDMCRAWWVWDAYGCPCCGWKILMKWECDFCVSGIVNSNEFDKMEKLFDDTTIIFCPSVMEMLDVMPNYITDKNGDSYHLIVYVSDDKEVQVIYENSQYWDRIYADESTKPLPNALAEMCLYLHDNWYIKW